MIYRIIGPPGTGKTKSIEKNVERAVGKYGDRGVIVMSLTKAAAIEASRRVDLPRGQVGTMHSLIYHAVGSPTIAETKIQEWNEIYPGLALESDKSSIDEPQAERFFSDSDAMQLLARGNILRARMIGRDVWPADVDEFFKKWENWKYECDYIDFTDLLEIALKEIDVAPHDPRVMFIDEGQDFSALEIAITLKWARHAMCKDTVIVGDPYQCMYAFRGSDPLDAFPLDSEFRVLKQSYRVPQAVHARAMSWISGMPGFREIEYLPRRNSYPNGQFVPGVCHDTGISWGDTEAIVHFLNSLPADETAMVMTSCAYMLEPLTYTLKDAGIPFWNPWRLKQGKWNPLRTGRGTSLHERLLAFLRPWPQVWSDQAAFWTPAELASWSAPLVANQVWIRGGKTKVEELGKRDDLTQRDAAHAIQAWMLEDVRATMPTPAWPIDKAIEWWYGKLAQKHLVRADYFKRVLKRDPMALAKKPRVTIGTIHSLKGSEADHVLLFPDVSQSGENEYMNRNTSAAVYRQFYVGMTRAKQSLSLGMAQGLGVPL